MLGAEGVLVGMWGPEFDRLTCRLFLEVVIAKQDLNEERNRFDGGGALGGKAVLLFLASQRVKGSGR